jgi:hypothetical protein
MYGLLIAFRNGLLAWEYTPRLPPSPLLALARLSGDGARKGLTCLRTVGGRRGEESRCVDVEVDVAVVCA